MADPNMEKFDEFTKNIRNADRRTKIMGLRDEFEAASKTPGFKADEIIQGLERVTQVAPRQFDAMLEAAQKGLEAMAAGAPAPGGPAAPPLSPEMQAFDTFVESIRNPARKTDMKGLRDKFEKASLVPGFDAKTEIKSLQDVVNLNARLYTDTLDATKKRLDTMGAGAPGAPGAPVVSEAMKKFDAFVDGIRNPQRQNDMRGLRDAFDKASKGAEFDADAGIKLLQEQVVNVNPRMYAGNLAQATALLNKAAAAAAPPAPGVPGAPAAPPVDPNMKAFDNFIDGVRNPERKAALQGLRADFENASKKGSFNLQNQLNQLEDLKNVNGRQFPQKLQDFKTQLGDLAMGPAGVGGMSPDALAAARAAGMNSGVRYEDPAASKPAVEPAIMSERLAVADAGKPGSRVPSQQTDSSAIPKADKSFQV